MSELRETLIFRSPLARPLVIGVATMCAVALAAMVASGGTGELLRSGPALTLVAVAIWALFWNPRAEVSDGGITVINVLRTVHVPWPALSMATAQWSLQVTAGDARVSAWGVPARSGMGARMAPRTRQTDTGSRFGGGRNAESAALAIGERQAALTAAGHLRKADRGRVPVVTTWHRTTIAVLTLTLAAAVASWGR